MTSAPNFSMNDLVSSLADLLGDRDEDAMTTTELSEALGVSKRVIYRRMDELGDRVVVTRKKIKNRIGVEQTVPAYRFAQKDEIDD